MSDRLLIVGASVRAQVESAIRAGFSVSAFDLFADRDTQFLVSQADNGSSVTQIRRWEDVLDFEQQLGDCDAAILCGGIENQIELIQALEGQVNLLGPGSESLAEVRDSVVLYQLLDQSLEGSGVRVPKTVRQVAGESGARQWLAKRNGSSGGLGVELLSTQSNARGSDGTDGQYFQELISGESISVLFLSRLDCSVDSDRGGSSTTILGATQQLVGDAGLGAGRFQYCGSIGPFDWLEPGQATGSLGVVFSANQVQQVQRIGEFLAQQYRLVGVWGIDFIVNQAGVWPVDVNPRLTASAELYDSKIAATTDFKSVIDLHVAACTQANDSRGVDWGRVGLGDLGFVEAKAILFNRNSGAVQISEQLSHVLMSEFDAEFFGSQQPGMTVADIPCPYQSIERGHPILTIRIRGGSAEEVQIQLREQAERIYRCF